jgi:mannose-6-phosphate isomerase-like protein (cupin superfamily)
MIVRHGTLAPIEFDGLEIRDYTAEEEVSSSVAEITIPPGVRHKRAWSRRSDKYYYVVEGTLDFVVGDETYILSGGDVCVIPQGVRFSYENKARSTARAVLVHTPGFDLAEEVFEE